MSKSTEDIQKLWGGISALTPEEVKLYREALTHSSNDSLPNNQRLAFLGDSVLKLIIREHFYKKQIGWNIGKLTDVCGELESHKNFANIAIKLELVNYMDIKNPPPETKTHEKLNEEVLEALFGAIYLSRGFEETKRIVMKYILADVEVSTGGYKTHAEMIKEAVKELGSATPNSIMAFISKKYPEIDVKKTSFRADIIGCSVNHTSSHHYPSMPKFLFYEKEKRTYQLYNPKKHGK